MNSERCMGPELGPALSVPPDFLVARHRRPVEAALLYDVGTAAATLDLASRMYSELIHDAIVRPAPLEKLTS